jgi:Fe-S cluster biogenesis protein NfuA
MFIQTEATPNPLSLKFIPGVSVNPGQPINLVDKAECGASPLASILFDIEHVKGVFLGSDFVTVTKDEEGEWELMKPEILLLIMEYFVAGKEAVVGDHHPTHEHNFSEEDRELAEQIIELIETRVRPAVAQDGGDIIFRGYENGIVKLELHGSCSGCPSSSVTLKNGIENMLKYYIPEVLAVEAV